MNNILLREPVRGFAVSSTYGQRKIGDGFHDGIDFAAPVGTKCYSAADNGIVMKSRKHDLDTWGKYVAVYYHDLKIMIMYAHLNEVLVDETDSVTMDTVLGLTGNTGFSTGAHVHIGIYNGGYDDMLDVDPENGAKHKNSVDPAIYFNQIPDDIKELDEEGYISMIRALNHGIFNLEDAVNPNEPLTRVQLAIISNRMHQKT